jgi:hypothetical protein
LWLRLRPGDATPSVVSVKFDGTIPDPEGITNDGTWIYLVGSQSRGGRAGADLLRFRFDPATGAANEVATLNGLPDLLRHAVPEIRAHRGKKAEGLNIEGLAWDAARKRLLLGLRAPLAGDDALVIPVAVAKGPLGPHTVSVEAALRVPLGGDGIRSIEQDGAGGFLIVAGSVTDARHFRLYSWSGKGAPKPVTELPSALKPEGVARIETGGRSVTVILGDSGRYAVLD